MPDSPPPDTTTTNRNCDFCNTTPALLYCRADTAKLCLSCDRQVHSTNPLFTKHTRSLLCDNCTSSPATIFCSNHTTVICHNCDWEIHSSPATHDRRPLEGFTGCPSVNDLLAILGFEDLGKKGVLFGDYDGFGSGYGFGSGDGFWDTTSFVSLDDLIVSSGGGDGDGDNYQAIGVPPLPKNRNAAFGTYKDELIRQLRELAKSEPNVDDGQEIIKPMNEFQSLMGTAQNTRFEGRSWDFERKFEPNVYSSYEPNTFQWCPDSSDTAGGQEFHTDHLTEHNTDTNCIVPDGKYDNVHNSSHVDANHEGQSHHLVAENAHVFPVREINSQERETAISRYKEKKKSRRYDKHIRYESRKVRAESRTRIRGRFAKIDR